MKKNSGSVLIIVIFLMVVLLMIAIGISTIGTGGLENSVSVDKDVVSTQKGETIADILAEGTTTTTSGVDDTFLDNIVLTDINSTYGAMGFIFIDSVPKEFRFTVDRVETSTSGGVKTNDPKKLSDMYISILGNSSWSLTGLGEGLSIYNESTPITIPAVLTATNGSIYYRITGNNRNPPFPKYYKISLSGGTGEYTMIVRLFYEKE